MRKEIFKNAWNFIKRLGLTLSEALKEAWKIWKKENEKVYNQGHLNSYMKFELLELPKVYIRHALNNYWICKDYWAKEELWFNCKTLMESYPKQFREVLEETGKDFKKELVFMGGKK